MFGVRGYDTAAACFYRIYELAVTRDNVRFREYFCHRPWPIASFPDPCDSNPRRAAFLTTLTRILCASFNERIERGLPRDAPAYIADFEALRAQKILGRPPSWAAKVMPLVEPLVLSRGDALEFSDELRDIGIIMKASHSSFT
ncbi:hypothetical protein DFH08DRAFT_1054977 [Mycena albidolilacea]|uniref:Uncharacterized protein n=1 Tax=Mycena albidolilacea TaxID=1033008 RepID=A0AAD6Z2T9_9AGAR|nr:hypothetical protein DFH08DRAFT_1054977 [Mycena albidolilacea]